MPDLSWISHLELHKCNQQYFLGVRLSDMLAKFQYYL